MALSTATELKAAVATWLAREDLSGSADDFVTLAEDHFNLDLRHRKMEEVEDLTPTAGVCALPADCRKVVQVVEKASIRRPLNFITPQAAEQQYPSRVSGLGCDYTIVGGNLYTFPLVTNTVELTYQQAIPSLNSNASNWLLAESPGLYLHGCRLMALDLINETDTPRYNAVATLTQKLIDGLNQQNELSQYGRTSFRINGHTP